MIKTDAHDNKTPYAEQ